MKLLFNYLKQHKKALIITLLLATVNQVFSLLDPQFFRMIIDQFAGNPADYTSSEFFSGIALLLAGSVGVAFVSRVAKNFQDYYTNVIALRVGATLYTDTIKHAFSLPYYVFEDERSGELLNKLKQARDNAQSLISLFIGNIFVSFIGVVFVLIYAFIVHWSVGLLYFAVIPIIGFTTFLIGKKIKSIQLDVVRESSALAGSTTETIRNVELVKSLGLENQEVNRLNETNDKILELEFKKQQSIRVLSFVQGTLINAVRAGLLFLMLFLIFKGQMTVGELFSLFIYSFFIFSPLQEMGNIATKYYETKASLEIVDQFLKMPKIAEMENPENLKKVTSLSFEKVSFSYNQSDSSAVKDIYFYAKQGETIAFVGPSGSGKSTLIKLLTGLYNPEEGSIYINEKNINLFDMAVLRDKIGLVLQETQLFAGSVRDNLLFVKSDATEEECLKALSLAKATGIFERSGKGLDTKIGEGGIKLSGGERQRLAIARALLRRPDLLIFDEATSALDSLTEREITDTIQSVSEVEKKTIKVLVAHRLSTVLHADRIYVLEKGSIVEYGSHKDLLTKKGLYFALWREQQSSR